MTLVDWLAGIGAVLAGIGGIFLVVRELNRRERRSADRQIDLLARQVHILRADLLAYDGWAFSVSRKMAENGIPVPPAPEPTALAEAPSDPKVAQWLSQRRHEDEEES